MTRPELIAALSGRFRANFADALADRVAAAGAFGLLYAVATAPPATLPKALRHKVAFRGAYVLERLYFASPAYLEPYVDRFCRLDFPACSDPSARRHFGKIMAHLLRHHAPDADTLGRIAETAGAWAVDPASKVAVRIGAVEVLRGCCEQVPWVIETWDDLMAMLARDATPGIACRLRRSWGAAVRK